MITQISANELHIELVSRIERMAPFSLLRLGDGEYEIMRYPDKSIDRCKERIGRWFPCGDFGDTQVKQICKLLFDAFRDSDLLGIPNETMLRRWPHYAGFERYVEKWGFVSRRRKFFCHLSLQMFAAEGRFRKLIAGVPFVGLITCRDVKDKLNAVVRAKKMEQVLIAGERFKYKSTVHVPLFEEPHWPDGFQRIRGIFEKRDCSREVWLVGAGGLGKTYCQWIKRQGGMALDVGTLFDGWAGVDTRPYLRKIGRFRL